MSVTRIASRYAKSLLDLAQEKGNTETVLGDVKGFAEAVKNRDFFLMLKSPIIKSSKKADIFKAIFGGKMDELSMAFFNIVLKKGREAYLPEIATEFVNQYKAMQKVSAVKLTTAQPISEAALQAIKDKLLGSDLTQQSVEIETEVDESLIGGFVVKVGDKQVDASVAHKLREMAKVIAE